MPIIKAKQKQEKEQIRITIERGIYEKIKQYCEWAGVQKFDDFIEQAAQYILSKDREWLAHSGADKNVSAEKVD